MSYFTGNKFIKCINMHIRNNEYAITFSRSLTELDIIVLLEPHLEIIGALDNVFMNKTLHDILVFWDLNHVEHIIEQIRAALENSNAIIKFT